MRLSRLLAEVEQGEEVVISRAGKPVAKLVRLDGSKRRRELGTYTGKIWIADDFDAPLDPESLTATDDSLFDIL